MEKTQFDPEISKMKTFKMALAILPIAILVVLEDGTIDYSNPQACETFGYPPDELVGKNIEILLPNHLRTTHKRHRKEFMKSPQRRTMGSKMLELWGKHKDGHNFHVDVGINPIYEPIGMKIIVAVIDISQREKNREELKKATEQLQKDMLELDKLASIDSLTQLLNRRMMMKQFEILINLANKQNSFLSIAILDIDNFKRYNDTFGHPEGDKVLRQLGEIIRQVVRKNDISARYGGEEFAVLMPMTSQEEALGSLERLRESIVMQSWPNRSITVSIGITTYIPDITDLALDMMPQLIIQADKALYQSKLNGKNQTTHFNNMENEVLNHYVGE